MPYELSLSKVQWNHLRPQELSLRCLRGGVACPLVIPSAGDGGLDKVAAGAEIPVDLLAQTLLELRKARGNLQATREVVIGYFRGGVASGFQVGPLLSWLFSWPSQRESVFSQVGYSGKESREFLEILKEKHPVQDLGLNDAITDA